MGDTRTGLTGLARMHDHGCALVVGEHNEPVTRVATDEHDPTPWLDRHGKRHPDQKVYLKALGVAGRRGPALSATMVRLVNSLPQGDTAEAEYGAVLAWAMTGWNRRPPAAPQEPRQQDPDRDRWMAELNATRLAAMLTALTRDDTAILAAWALEQRDRLWWPDGHTDVEPVPPLPATAGPVSPLERLAFQAGLAEFRDSVTTAYPDDRYELTEAYDLGRELGHRLTDRHYDDTTD